MILVLMFITHFIADFLLQTRKVAENKSSNIKYLLIHIGIIFIAFLPFGVKFSFYNAIIHMIIDSCIWKGYKVLYVRRGIKEFYKDSMFYNFIGLDQLLHALTIIILYESVL